MKYAMAWVYNENHNAKTKGGVFSDDFGLRTPVVLKPFRTKGDISIVARVNVWPETSNLLPWDNSVARGGYPLHTRRNRIVPLVRLHFLLLLLLSKVSF